MNKIMIIVLALCMLLSSSVAFADDEDVPNDMMVASSAQASETIDFTNDTFSVSGDAYTFAGCPWLSSPEEVEKILGISLGEPAITMPTDEMTFTVEVYMPKARIAYSFGEGILSFEFRDGQLKSVQSVIKDVDVPAMYTALTEELHAQMGEPAKVTETDKEILIGDNMAHLVVSAQQWNSLVREDGKYTTLQVKKSGTGDDMSLSIGYALFETQSK